jgi:hypothetical protein
MTLYEATALVENLIDAFHEYEQVPGEGYRSEARWAARERYLIARQQVITALTESSQAVRPSAGDDTPAG